MKNLGLVVLSGVALLQGVTAACCRGNRCLKAVVSAGQDGLDDCAENLVVTLTLTPSALTETVTVVETAEATALFTEELTETAATETVLFTETTTVTASQTDIVSETVTVVFTTTDIQEAAVTSTSTRYQGGATLLKARETLSALPLPDYALAVCADWDQYVNACKCAGFETTTITVPAARETVTVTADEAVTTTVATLSVTKTDTVSVTATALVTEIDTALVTETATGTTIITVSTTTTVSITSTPTVIVPLTCKANGVSFRAASNPFPDGSTRWMNAPVHQNADAPLWQFSPSTGLTPYYLSMSTWVFDSNGHLELAGVIGTATQVLAAYVDPSSTDATLDVKLMAKSDLEAAVAAGTALRVKGCVNAETNAITMSANGRHNMVSCGLALYLTTGDGSDIRPDCVQLTPTAA